MSLRTHLLPVPLLVPLLLSLASCVTFEKVPLPLACDARPGSCRGGFRGI